MPASAAAVGADGSVARHGTRQAGLVLLVLLMLLGWIYRAARPLLEGLAWVALDATFATSVSEEATRAAVAMTQPVTPTHTAEPAVTARR